MQTPLVLSASAAASGAVIGRRRCRLTGACSLAGHNFYRGVFGGPRCRGAPANGSGQLTRARSEIMHAAKSIRATSVSLRRRHRERSSFQRPRDYPAIFFRSRNRVEIGNLALKSIKYRYCIIVSQMYL